MASAHWIVSVAPGCLAWLLLAVADEYEFGCAVRIGAIIRFAIETAMRFSEIARMAWERVDLRAGTVFLPDTKNGDARAVPLTLAARGDGLFTASLVPSTAGK